ncbi:MAG: hypothetical protein RL326_1614 [Pseudomonadota bacterium]|jgi:hypothetical protein
MSLTRLDCDIFRGRESPADASSYVALNPVSKPAQLVFAGSTAVLQGLGSQVAYRLALEYFMRGVESHYATVRDGQSTQEKSQGGEDAVVTLLEDAFRTANSSVYGFGHKLAAGGRMAASLLGMVIDEGRFAAGRVGTGSVYLFRDKQLFPFFGSDEAERAVVGDLEEFPSDLSVQRQAFVGANSLIDVEIASVMLGAGDVICAFSRPLSSLNETLLFQHLEAVSAEGFPMTQTPHAAEDLCVEVFTQPDTLSFCCLATVGPEVIYCSKQVA